MKELYIKILSVLLMSTLFGCATVMNGTTQKIGIASSPSGATVKINDEELGETPLFADLKRNKEHIVTIEMAGYETKDLVINKKVSGWVWGNIVLGGLIGLAIDAVSGGIYQLTPEQLDAELNTSVAKNSNQQGLYIVATLEAKDEWTKIGNLKPQEITH
jgi:hypothetical protein